MRRALLFVLPVLLLAAPVLAGEDDTRTVQIHDAADLAERIPDLTALVGSLVPDATVHEQKPGIFVVKASPSVHDDFGRILAGLRRSLATGDAVVKQALDAARADAGTLALLRSTSIDLTFEHAPVRELVLALARSAGLSMIISPAANQAMTDVVTSVRFVEAPARGALDVITRMANVTWVLESGIVRILTLDEASEVRVRLEFIEGVLEGEMLEDNVVTDVEIEDHIPLEVALPPSAESPEDLKGMLRALADEVRALRKEVKEVRSILEELRAR